MPDTCVVGACGCAGPAHAVPTCMCPDGECFSAEQGCVNPCSDIWAQCADAGPAKDAGPSTKDAGPVTKDASPTTKDAATKTDAAAELESSSGCSTSPVGAGSHGSAWFLGLGAIGIALQAASRRRRRS
jgi:hypothetical protein